MRRRERRKFSRSYSISVVVLILTMLSFQIFFVVSGIHSVSKESSLEGVSKKSNNKKNNTKENSLKENLAKEKFTKGNLTEEAFERESLIRERDQKRSFVAENSLKGDGYNSDNKGSISPDRSKIGMKAQKERVQPGVVFKFFDPNLASLDELMMFGLSSRQASSIINYRTKGGSFRNKEDLKKMYNIPDSLYEELKEFIFIETDLYQERDRVGTASEVKRDRVGAISEVKGEMIELNLADSLQLISLYGIGPYYASKIMEYREKLGGFYSAEQLLEIKGFESDRYSSISDKVYADKGMIKRLDLNEASKEELAAHPYIGSYMARGILRLRQHLAPIKLSLITLIENGLLSESMASGLSEYFK